MFIKTRCMPPNIEHIDIYVVFVSDILHMKPLKIDIDGKGLLGGDEEMGITVEDGHTYILIQDIFDICDVSEAARVYYEMSVLLYHYCEKLDEYNYASSIAAEYEYVARGIMNESEWSELNAHAFAYLCIENFFGMPIYVGENTDTIAERADEVRDRFDEFVHDAYFKSFSDILEKENFI